MKDLLRVFNVLTVAAILSILGVVVQAFILRDIDRLFNVGIVAKLTYEGLYGCLIGMAVIRVANDRSMRKKPRDREMTKEDVDQEYRMMDSAPQQMIRGFAVTVSFWLIIWILSYVMHNTFTIFAT